MNTLLEPGALLEWQHHFDGKIEDRDRLQRGVSIYT